MFIDCFDEHHVLIKFRCVYPVANNASAVAAIKGAIADWESKTCIRFRNRTTERNYEEIYAGSG